MANLSRQSVATAPPFMDCLPRSLKDVWCGVGRGHFGPFSVLWFMLRLADMFLLLLLLL